jgi:uncharacterized protein YdeI (YjbR/CyaY-like superfamily)
MKNASAEVDAYIARSADFARPILTKLRKLFHQARPDIGEKMKWSFPHFEYRGIVASMAAFKEHVRFGFWKWKLLSDPHNYFGGRKEGETAMNGARITDVSELPPDKILIEYIREAMALNEKGVKTPRKKPASRGELKVPEDLLAALKRNKKTLATFEGFSPSHKREYVDWLMEAKHEATREKRLATAIEWMAEGKPRNWKYMRK